MNVVKEIASATLWQAAKDYLKGTEKQKNQILKDLESSWMLFLTDGMSEIVAEKLLHNPKEIKQRMKIIEERTSK